MKREEITVEAVKIIIQNTEYGEYDQYHDWTPSYNLNDKINFLAQMLDNWNYTDDEGKILIAQFCKKLLNESGINNLLVLDKLYCYTQIPTIDNVIKEFINRS